jgi:putative sterol carrier protein
MIKYQYCTPEWLEESGRIYRSNPGLEEKLKKISAKVCFRVKADSAWGIDKDIIFGTFIEAGKLTKIAFFGEEDAKQESEYLLAATPQEWKKLLRKEHRFLTDFMLGKIKLEKGNKVTILGLAPYAPLLIDALTQAQIQFPDEMSVEELTKYRAYIEEFRKNMTV